VGLATGKKVYIVTSRGGIHRDQPSDQMTPYLRAVLAFLGMTDVSFVYAEGMAFAAEQGLASARAQITELLAA
jgi:FMN-dependent NADH-azoreductase